MRSFLAIELPASTRTALDAFGERLRRRGLKASWVKPDRMHLTLRFLGDVAPEQFERLGPFLTAAWADMTGPVLLVRGMGAFPSQRKPAVVWAGVETLQGDLSALQQKAEDGARFLGIPADSNPFHAHISLARLRNRAQAAAFALALRAYDAPAMAPEFGDEFKARNVVLFSSELTSTGPIYRPLQEFTLR